MRYLQFRYLALALFTFAVGVGISPVRFYVESIGCGRNNSTTSYRSSYFMQTAESYVSYDCEAHALDAFNEELSQAISVYDISPKVNKNGVLIQDRAIAVFYHQGNDEYFVALLWREGSVLRSIHSRSYTHVKDFDKQNF